MVTASQKTISILIINKPLLWSCIDNHEWDASLHSIQRGSWCPICKDNSLKLDFQVARDLAFNKGGECLSEKYDNIISPLLWKCCNGHQWNASLNSIKNQDSHCVKITEKIFVEKSLQNI